MRSGKEPCCVNSGQAFTGISANTPFYNITTSIAMVLGRFGLAIPALALAQLFALQPRRVPTAGTLPTDNLLFSIVIVVGTAIVVVALTYLPAIALGPIVEHLLMIGR